MAGTYGVMDDTSFLTSAPGALILSLTYVPMMASLFLKHTIVVKPTLADRFFEQQLRRLAGKRRGHQIQSRLRFWLD